MQNAVMTELETSTRIERKRMTNHNTPQLSGMDSANHCAASPGLSALSTTTIHYEPTIGMGLYTKTAWRHIAVDCYVDNKDISTNI
jgi:hypothetical protein